ncbi:sulfatase-like hydrolase/transferase [Hansschlegelia zhihuaiae]|uniref:Sulfatase N-terminal domain-containing protein n=1 Tax=Hansschlegelia zhihuaiae TaxID=405005 RepID=A0A4Q0MMV0_9HYPH|nr:sulfatase-like hydrolase/transferase [Hansschlegelia zhihuaiae]RXF75088.1 hypothetical protein EK403_03305 [Hansschlegelia zhihuaiae]
MITRRTANAGLLGAVAALAAPAIARAQTPPNVVMIVLDDLNDWIEPLGGYPLSQTPNLAALAAESVNFRRAYCATPYCATSRTATLFGLEPWVTGVYARGEDWPVGSRIVTGQRSLPWHFRDRGYKTLSVGKFFHTGWRAGDGPRKRAASQWPDAWDFLENCGSGSCVAPRDGGDAFDYGPQIFATEQQPDTIRTQWFIDNVLNASHDAPFFGVIGLQKPHLPWRPPTEFLELFPLEDIVYPLGVMTEDRRQDVTMATDKDLRDLPSSAIEFVRQFGERDSFGTNKALGIINSGEWLNVIRHYLATIAFADHSVGLVRSALAASAHADNTIVVLWSDHGWQLGEKLAWRKFTLWERALRVPFMISGPGVTPGNCDTPISLIDLFPTLCDLALGAVPTKEDLGKFDLSGTSRKSWLSSPTTPRDNVAVASWGLTTAETNALLPNAPRLHLTARSNTARLIQYDGGDREFYRKPDDEFEFFNEYESPSPALVAEADAMTAAFPSPSAYAQRAGGGSDDED